MDYTNYLPAGVVAVVLTADSEAVGAEKGHPSKKYKWIKQIYFWALLALSLPRAQIYNAININWEKKRKIYEFKYFWVCFFC